MSTEYCYCRNRLLGGRRHVFVCLFMAMAWFAVEARAADKAETDVAKNAVPPLAAEFSNFDDALLLAVTKAGERLVAVGEHGLILLSDDHGQSWRQSRAGVPDTTLSAVTFINADEGWAAGREEAVLRSRDGGETWQVQHWNPYPDSGLEAALLEIHFASAGQGFAVGANGVLMRSSDGGDSWQRETLMHSEGYEPHLFDISGGGNSPLYIAAEEGTLLRSTDGARSWQALAVPFAGSLFGAVPVGDQGVLAYAMLGKAFYSADAGESWQQLETNTRNAWMNARPWSTGQALLAGYRGTLALFDAASGKVVLQKQHHRRAISDLLPLSDQRVVLVGEGGAWTRALSGQEVSE